MSAGDDLPRPPIELLPRLQEWKSANDDDFDLGSLLSAEGNFDIAVAFSSFFWPEFIEIDGCIFLKGRYHPKKFTAWMTRFNGNLSSVELMINHTHFYDVLYNDDRKNEHSIKTF